MVWLLEQGARASIRDDSWGDPDSPPVEGEIEVSKAISAMRSADALERIADKLERLSIEEGELQVYARTVEA